MKKISILSLATVLAVSIFSSCGNSYKEKAVELKNQTDSLNYAFGYANGCTFSDYYFKEVDDKDKAIKVFLDQMNKSYESDSVDEEIDQLFELGVKVGSWFRDQQENGLLDKDSEIKFDYKKVKEGFETGLKRVENGDEGISSEEAGEIIKDEMERIYKAKEEKAAKELEESLQDNDLETVTEIEIDSIN